MLKHYVQLEPPHCCSYRKEDSSSYETATDSESDAGGDKQEEVKARWAMGTKYGGVIVQLEVWLKKKNLG